MLRETTVRFIRAEIEQFPEVQTWLKTVSSKTGKSYLSALMKLCNWCGKDPHQLIIERDAERNNPDPIKRTGIREQ